MHYSEITAEAQLKDKVKFTLNSNGYQFNMSGILVGITPYEISVKLKKEFGDGYVVKDFLLTCITNFVNCTVDCDLGI